MKHEKIYLKEHFSVLGNNDANPTLTLYLPYNSVEMNRQDCKRPCVIVCPGGAYCMCSERESEPVVFEFINQGFNVFLLNYSVAPHRFPTQLCEIAATLELIYKNAEHQHHCQLDRAGGDPA